MYNAKLTALIAVITLANPALSSAEVAALVGQICPELNWRELEECKDNALCALHNPSAAMMHANNMYSVVEPEACY